MAARSLEIRGNLQSEYPDVYTNEALAALEALAPLDKERQALMRARIERRNARSRNKQRITFLDPNATIGRTKIKVQDARAGNFEGREIPRDLQRQWIQGTGPAARPNSSVEKSIRNVAYALLFGRRRLDVRRRRRPGPDHHDVARQSPQSEAGDRSRSGFHEDRRAGCRRDERMGCGVLQAADHRGLEEATRLHNQDLSGPRPASG